MLYMLIWYVQDFFQVLVMGISIVPNLFLLSLLAGALLQHTQSNKAITFIWIAFLGGLIWDLRWTNLPGLTASINALSVSAAVSFWHKTPSQGRGTVLFGAILFAISVISGFTHYLFWSIPNQAALRQLLVQQIITLPIIALVSIVFMKASEKNV